MKNSVQRGIPGRGWRSTASRIGWLLATSLEDWPPSDDVQKMIMRVPRKKSFVPDLLNICDQLARRGYPKAIEMKAEIKHVFLED